MVLTLRRWTGSGSCSRWSRSGDTGRASRKRRKERDLVWRVKERNAAAVKGIKVLPLLTLLYRSAPTAAGIVIEFRLPMTLPYQATETLAGGLVEFLPWSTKDFDTLCGICSGCGDIG